MSSNLKARSASLRSGEKALRDNVPIRLSDWSTTSLVPKDTVPKSSIIKFSVLTHNHGVGGTGKSVAYSFGTRSAIKVVTLEDNPREVIQVWQSIFKEMLPAMIDVNPVTAVELFMAHLSGTATTEFEQILFDAAGELYDKYIDPEYNRLIRKYKDVDFINARKSLADIRAMSDPDAVKAALEIIPWVQRNKRRKEGRQSLHGIVPYDFLIVPPIFPKPPGKPALGKFAGWNHEGVSVMSPCAWLRAHNHGWEFAERFFDLVFSKVQILAFKSFGSHAGRTQIEYLSEDLKFDPLHTLKAYFRLIQAHSEAQPYYPPIAHDSEVGRVFSDTRKIQIVWNSCSEIFHKELVNLNINRVDDFHGDYEMCKTKFLLAEQHFLPKKTIVDTSNKNDSGNKPGAGKGKGKGSDNKKKNPSKDKQKITCDYCGGDHFRINCFKDPNGPKFRGNNPSKPGGGAGAGNKSSFKGKRSNEAGMMAFDDWAAQDDKRARYQEYCRAMGESDMNTMAEM